MGLDSPGTDLVSQSKYISAYLNVFRGWRSDLRNQLFKGSSRRARGIICQLSSPAYYLSETNVLRSKVKNLGLRGLLLRVGLSQDGSQKTCFGLLNTAC